MTNRNLRLEAIREAKKRLGDQWERGGYAMKEEAWKIRLQKALAKQELGQETGGNINGLCTEFLEMQKVRLALEGLAQEEEKELANS